MTAQELIATFEIFAEAPEGISQLRGFVLQLAMRGKLVPQDPNDEPASELLQRLAKERAQLVKTKEIKRPKKVSSIDKDSSPFTLPEEWQWMRLGSIVRGLRYGSSAKSAKSGQVPVLRMGNLQSGEIDWADLKYSSDPDEIEKYKLSPMSVLFNRTNSPALVGKTGIYRGEQPALFAGYLIHIDLMPELDPEYFNLALNSPYAKGWCWEIKTDGVSQSNISASKLATFPAPIPPIAEQKRIVARANELMSLIDRLEAAKNVRDETRVALRDSALAALREADTPEEVEVAWNRVAMNLSDLIREPGDVESLREVVLELAVRGKLVMQNVSEEDAKTFLARIAKEKKQLIKQKQAQRSKVSGSANPEDIPFELPVGWACCHFEDLHTQMGAGSTPKGGKKVYIDEGGYPFLRSQNIWNDGIQLDGVARIPSKTHQKMSRTIVRPHDVLLNITGASIGRSAVAPAEFAEANVSQHVAILRPVDPQTSKWVHLYLISPVGYRNIMDVQVGISREGLSMTRLREFVIPIPPLAEQKRIVARVDELMTLIDRLEVHLTTRKELHEKFAAAAVHHFEMESSKPRKAEQLTLGLDA